MGQSLAIPRVIPNDWKRLDLIVNKIKMRLGSASSPTVAGLTVTGLTASTLIGANASKALESVTIGTGLDYTRPTLSLSHLGIEALTDPGADKILFWDDSASACKWLGMGNSVVITDVTIDTIQDIRVTASPTFTGLTLSGLTQGSVLFAGASGVISQDNDKLFWDATNFRLGIGTASPGTELFIENTTDPEVKVKNSTIGHTGSFGPTNTYDQYPRVAFRIANDVQGEGIVNAGLVIFPDTTAQKPCIVEAYTNEDISTNDTKRISLLVNADYAIVLVGRKQGNDGDIPLRLSTNGIGAFSGIFIDSPANNARVGLNELLPETALEITTAQPYLTLHNSTHEDTDGGRESRLNFKGEQSGGEETTLARIEVSHDGAADDQKGKVVISTNDGSDADTPTDHVAIDAAGNTKIGDAGTTNYSKFEADGTLVFNGAATVWDDLQFTISDAKVPAANFPTWETFTTNTKEYSFAVDDYIDTKANEVSHAWKQGTTGHAHLHVTTKAANSTGSNRYAKFTIYLGYCDTDEIWQETSLTAELTIPNGTSALQMFYLDMGDLTLTNYLLEAEIKMRVNRITATGGTEYSGNIFLTQAGIHFEYDTGGSRAETTK